MIHYNDYLWHQTSLITLQHAFRYHWPDYQCHKVPFLTVLKHAKSPETIENSWTYLVCRNNFSCYSTSHSAVCCKNWYIKADWEMSVEGIEIQDMGRWQSKKLKHHEGWDQGREHDTSVWMLHCADSDQVWKWQCTRRETDCMLYDCIYTIPIYIYIYSMCKAEHEKRAQRTCIHMTYISIRRQHELMTWTWTFYFCLHGHESKIYIYI